MTFGVRGMASPDEHLPNTARSVGPDPKRHGFVIHSGCDNFMPASVRAVNRNRLAEADHETDVLPKSA
ncbi:hypothetical protein D3P04_17870 [Paracoccus onubensis]|uniref:Uncharacterized protein n=1 Tax=Paracoccus onubensis TaxID=1675788 RepID=A0A418SPY7_9RHOB|nr:hypothetical protein D3P04_17870 [Paracoccus onubensis]